VSLKPERRSKRQKNFDPTMVEVQLAEGHYHYYANRDYIRALESYYGVLRNDPNNSIALEHVGYVQRRMGKWVASLDKHLEAYKRDPYNIDLVRSIGDNYFYLRNFLQAEIYFKKALDISPKLTHPYVALARIAFQKSGDPEDALAAMNTKIRVTNFEWYARVKIYFIALTGNLNTVNELINSVPSSDFQLGPLVNSRNFHLGMAHKIVGEKTKADDYLNSIVPDLEIAYRLEPKKDQWMRLLSYSYAYLGRKEEAISVALNRVENIKISEDAFWGTRIEYDLAWIYMIVGEYDKAFDKVELLLSIPSPMSVETLEAFPIWKPLHNLPRYKEIVKKFGPQA